MNWRPSKQLEDVMLGRVGWDDAQPAIRSWAMRFVYDAARQVLAAPKERRRGMIDKVPPTMRPVLEAEIMRIWRAQKRPGANARPVGAREEN